MEAPADFGEPRRGPVRVYPLAGAPHGGVALRRGPPTPSPGARSVTTISTPPRNKARRCSIGPGSKSPNASTARETNQPRTLVALHVVTVLNPCGRERTDLAWTGRIHSVGAGAPQWTCETREWKILSRSQIVWEDSRFHRASMGAEVAFLARKVPAVGYDTYHVSLIVQAPPAAFNGRG